MSISNRLQEQLRIRDRNWAKLDGTHRSNPPAGRTLQPSPGSDPFHWRHQLERRRDLEQTRADRAFPPALQSDAPLQGIEHSTPLGTCLRFSHCEEPGPEGFVPGVFSQRLASLLQLLYRKNVDCRSSQIAFFDTETTGLSGGTGTYVFLVGIGVWRRGRFWVEQYLMRHFQEEPALLWALSERLQKIKVLVTFNGKSFDLPVLQTRYVLSRLRWPLQRVVHLDLVHPARRLWKTSGGDCRLCSLEHQVLGIQRTDDVPGHLIPELYFNFMRSGNPFGLKSVLQHNRLDITSLQRLSQFLTERLLGLCDQEQMETEELLGLGRYFHHLRQPDLSLKLHQTALSRGLPPRLRVLAMKQLALLLQAKKQHAQAALIWQELLSAPDTFLPLAYQQLAIHWEHREKDLSKALATVNQAIARLQQAGQGAGALGNLSKWRHRRDRLERKMGKTRESPDSKKLLHRSQDINSKALHPGGPSPKVRAPKAGSVWLHPTEVDPE